MGAVGRVIAGVLVAGRRVFDAAAGRPVRVAHSRIAGITAIDHQTRSPFSNATSPNRLGAVILSVRLLGSRISEMALIVRFV